MLEAGPKKSVAEDTSEDILFLDESSVANKWIVPWLEETQTKLESGLKYERIILKNPYVRQYRN